MDSISTNQIVTWSIFALFWIVAFLIMRAIVLWYWKIDKVVVLLEKIEKHLRKMR